MKKKLAIALGCLLMGLSAHAAEESGSGKNDYTKFVERPYTEVLDAVKQAAQQEGFRVSNVHDIAASLKKDGLQRAPYATVEVCNSKIAAEVLHAQENSSRPGSFGNVSNGCFGKWRTKVYSAAFLTVQAVQAKYGKNRKPLGEDIQDCMLQLLERKDKVSAELEDSVVVN